MKQDTIHSISDLLAKAGVIKIGVITYHATVPLVLNTGLAFGADLDALTIARDNYEQGKLTLDERMALVDSIMAIGRNDLTLGRDVLKPHLGYEYSDKYGAIGLNQGTAAIPRSVDGVQSTLGAYKGFFEAHPALENTALAITAAHYESLFDQLLVARGEVNVQKKNVEDLMAVRDSKEVQLRKRIRWLINELGQNVDPLSSMWTAFGLNKPGADETPDQEEAVQVSLLGPTTAVVKWNAAARATYYRVWSRIHGTTGNYVPMGSPADLDITLENLPANSALDIVVTAINSGGESPVSDVITLTTSA